MTQSSSGHAGAKRAIAQVARRRRTTIYQAIEALEDRRLLTVASNGPVVASIVVNSTQDNVNDSNISGTTITLREAINYEDANSGGTITFDPTVFATAEIIGMNDGTLDLTNTAHSITITGPAATLAINGEGEVTPFTVQSNVTAEIDNLTIKNGDTLNAGGAIVDNGTLTLKNDIVSHNQAGIGAAVDVGGQFTAINTTFDSNAAGAGGVMYEDGQNTSSTFRGCTFSNNSSIATDGDGGALDIGSDSAPTVNIVDSTFYGNTSKGEGGAIYLAKGSLTIQDSTLTDNTTFESQGSGGAIGVGGGGVGTNPITLDNDIIAGNIFSNEGGAIAQSSISGDGVAVSEADDISTEAGSASFPVTGGFNLIGTGGSGGLTDGTNGNQVGVANPKLGSLANNGGPTETIALLNGSPAIDTGSNALLPTDPSTSQPIATDQRGLSRIVNGTVDIGAVEVAPNNVVVSNINDMGTGSLRAAVASANSSSGPTFITFDPTVFATAQTITLTSGELELTNTGQLTTITGSSAGVTVSGGKTSRVFQIDANVPANIADLTISGGSTTGGGAGILDYGTLNLTDSTVSGNTGISGGIAVEGSVNLVNDTISGNVASVFGTAEFGGGIFVDTGGTLVLTLSTVSNNSGFRGGGISNDGSATIADTIIAGNTGTGSDPDVEGAFSSQGHNLIGDVGDTSGWVGSDKTGNDASPLNANLGLLGNNGGPTFTMLPGPLSPAIGAGSAALIPNDPNTGVPFATDQRGATRIQNHTVDIGAVETTPAPASTGSLNGSVGPGASSYNLTQMGTIDWAHWGTNQNASAFDDKATGGGQISNVTRVGAGSYGAYTDSSRDVIWSDGTPLAKDNGDQSYIWANNATGAGYSFTVPADTTTRTLYVDLGGYDSGGTLTAHLSDTSATDFTTSFSGPGIYSDIVAITFKAGSASQNLLITYTKTAGIGVSGGSVDLDAAWIGQPLTNLSPVIGLNPKSQTVSAGTDVTFTASASTIATSAPTVQWYVSTDGGKTFLGYAGGITNTIDIGPATLADNGNEYEAIFTTSAGTATTSAATLTVTSAPSGSLVGSSSTAAPSYNFTQRGTTDWIHWGRASNVNNVDRKATGGSQISNVTRVGGGSYGAYADPSRDSIWTDGTPTAKDTGDTAYIWANNAAGAGYSFTAPADTTTRTLYIYLGGYDSGGTFTATLSDSSATPYTVNFSGASHYTELVAITYKAGAAGQKLNLSYTKAANVGVLGGSVDLIGAWLA